MYSSFILLWELKLSSQNKSVLALLIHDIPLRNIVEPLIITCPTEKAIRRHKGKRERKREKWRGSVILLYQFLDYSVDINLQL